MPDRPSGTITFLFTDIEGSTKLWERFPQAMPGALARHDEILKMVIEANGGYVFKTIGDAVCNAFQTAQDALHAALQAQLALHAEDWSPEFQIRVRIALHSGAADERGGDYFGQPVNRIARLLNIGHGGQILLSQTTYELIQQRLPEGARLRDMGQHLLKDLQRPEVVYQLCHADLPADFPPLRSLNTFPNNLPQQVTSFVGREQEIEEVRQLLDKTRLLTLTGAGGCGKTRLALQIAADLTAGDSDGVWLVELASVTDPALVPQAIASVLSIREEPGRSITQTLTDALKEKDLLFILDNCEHLLDACARLSDTLLRTCPRIRILATSRESLGIAGERSYRVPSLPTPPPAQELKKRVAGLPEKGLVSLLMDYESVRLFIERAQAAQPHFQINAQSLTAIAQICNRLDGIPLAIELAAARVRAMSAEQIAARLDDRFRLLTGGSRTALPRQQTLRATIDWSYNLLSEKEQALLRRLSVFAGGWTLEAAEKVCSDDAVIELKDND